MMKQFIFILCSFVFVTTQLHSQHTKKVKKATKKTVLQNKKINNEILFAYKWNAVELNGEKLSDEVRAWLVFNAGETNSVNGSSGCNGITGSVELKGKDSLKFTAMAATRRMCPGDADAAERKFMVMLGEATTWNIKGEELSLLNAGTVLAKFTPDKTLTTQQQQLNGTWELNYISGTKIAFKGLYPTKKPQLIFKLPALEANGNSSCNGFSSRIKIIGNKINFADPLSTMMFCEGGGEQAFFSALKKITSFSVTENTLTLITGDIAMMRFSRK